MYHCKFANEITSFVVELSAVEVGEHEKRTEIHLHAFKRIKKTTPQGLPHMAVFYCLRPFKSYVGGNTVQLCNIPGPDPFVATVNTDLCEKGSSVVSSDATFVRFATLRVWFRHGGGVLTAGITIDECL